MTTEQKQTIGLVKFPCRLSYVALAEKKMNDMSKKEEYSVECRIPFTDKEALAKIRQAIKDVWIEKFSADTKTWPPSFRREGLFDSHLSLDGKDGYPLRDGNMKDNDEYKGLAFLSAKDQKNRPKCARKLESGGWVEVPVQDIESTIYSGCYAEVVVQFFAYDNKEAKVKGVGASIRAVMKTADGERLGGGAPVNMTDFFGEGASIEEAAGDMSFDV